MINNVGDIITQVLVRNNRTTTDSFVTDTILQGWTSDANKWATSFHKWPFTEGRSSTTYTTSTTDENGLAYTTYPEGWKSDSIRILTIGGKRLQKLNFSDFLRYLEDNPASQERIYSDYNRQLYVNVNSDVSGTLTAYGQYTPLLDTTDLTATTIFSNYDEEGNEAIIEKMTSYLKRREHLPQEAELHDKRAIEKLEEIWNRIKDEQFAYQTKDRNMFERFDVLQGDLTDDLFRRDQF